MEEYENIEQFKILEDENKKLKARIRLLESQLHSPDSVGDYVYQEYIR